MSIAEIKGKLSPSRVHDRSEDFLTSDVFGTKDFVSDANPFLARGDRPLSGPLTGTLEIFGSDRELRRSRA